MILLKFIFACYPALVAGHGYMAIPKARTGDDGGTGLRSPKLSPWAGYKEVIDLDQRGCLGPPPSTNSEIAARGATPNPPIMTIGQPFTVSWDIRLGHSLSKNHVRIAYRSYQMGALPNADSLTQFEQGILFEKEDTDADRQLEQSPTYDMYLTTGTHSMAVTLPPNAQPGPAELQWVWASERDGAGGYYISCADVMISAATDPGITLPPSSIPLTPVASPVDPNSLQCYVGTDRNREQQRCTAPLNTRCMTTWVNSRYYYRCSSRDYCDAAMTSAINEGKKEGIVLAKEGLTSLKCCETDLCNDRNIVTLPSEWSASWQPLAIMGFITGLAHLLL